MENSWKNEIGSVGRDEAGKLVGSGLYFCRLVAGEEVATIKLLNLR